MNCKLYGRYPFCKQCLTTNEGCKDYYAEEERQRIANYIKEENK